MFSVGLGSSSLEAFRAEEGFGLVWAVSSSREFFIKNVISVSRDIRWGAFPLWSFSLSRNPLPQILIVPTKLFGRCDVRLKEKPH